MGPSVSLVGPSVGVPEEEDVGLLLILILLGVLLPLVADEGGSEGAVVGVPEKEDVGLLLILILLGVLPLGADVGESEGAVVGVDVVGPAIGDTVVAVRKKHLWLTLLGIYTHCNL